MRDPKPQPLPLRVLSTTYASICTNFGCKERESLPLQEMARRALLTCIRLAFFGLCAGFVGASLSLLLHAQTQTMPERAAKLEVATSLLQTQVEMMQREIDHLGSEVATMDGIGIGLGSALGLLQVLQIVLGKRGVP